MNPQGASISMAMSNEVNVFSILCLMSCLTAMTMLSLVSLVLLCCIRIFFTVWIVEWLWNYEYEARVTFIMLWLGNGHWRLQPWSFKFHHQRVLQEGFSSKGALKSCNNTNIFSVWNICTPEVIYCHWACICICVCIYYIYKYILFSCLIFYLYVVCVLNLIYIFFYKIVDSVSILHVLIEHGRQVIFFSILLL